MILAKKPKTIEKRGTFYCAECGHKLGYYEKYLDNYCSRCGTKVKEG